MVNVVNLNNELYNSKFSSWINFPFTKIIKKRTFVKLVCLKQS